jgi:glycosyltransferase involved in cell wall biosynthesis
VNRDKNLGVSLVIPIYNEERILRSAVTELMLSLRACGWKYELILAENGSSDRTVAIAEELCRANQEVRLISVGSPNYGKALRQGILAARGKVIICEEIDLCDSVFHRLAVEALETTSVDMVIGSKLIRGAMDQRPFLRHAASLMYTLLLRCLLGFPGTDTHGLKAFKRQRLIALVEACVIEKDVFASELVIRAYRKGLDVREVPVRIAEKRAPSINLLKRIPNVLLHLAKLMWVIRFARPRPPSTGAIAHRPAVDD